MLVNMVFTSNAAAYKFLADWFLLCIALATVIGLILRGYKERNK